MIKNLYNAKNETWQVVWLNILNHQRHRVEQWAVTFLPEKSSAVIIADWLMECHAEVCKYHGWDQTLDGEFFGTTSSQAIATAQGELDR